MFFFFSPPFSFFHPSVEWSQQLVALAYEHNRRTGDTMVGNRGNRHEHINGQQQGTKRWGARAGEGQTYSASMTEKSARQLTETVVEVVGRVLW